MDSDIEIVEHDILDNPQIKEIFTDFSQVKIEVHEGDVAEKIIEDLADLTGENQDCETEFLECPVAEDHIQESPEDYNELTPKDCVETIPEDHDENIPGNHEICDYKQEYPDFSVVEIKEEIEQFEGTDYTDFEEFPPEPYNSDLPPEDIYHFNNKIILGSKPCQSIAQKNDEYQIDIEKENLDAVVLLEDWGVHLQESLSFCKECGILFSTPNGLDAHNMTSHSFLVAVSKNVALKSTAKPAYARKSTGAVVARSSRSIARKSTGSNNILASKFCNHCNMVFPDHTALIKHLYELLPLKQFKCSACQAVFNTQKELVDHNVIHVKTEKPRVKKEKIVKEVTAFKKKLLYEEDLKKKCPVSPKREVMAVPLSVLFQCTKCNIHFLTAFAGLQHWIICNAGSNNKKTTCKTCKRKLRDIDTVMHKKQHEICTKFKVYKITKNINERTLCKCPRCGVHFNDLTMKPHFKSCGKLPTAHCQKCNILIPKSKIEWHSKKHTKQNLKPKDFIIIQHVLQNRTGKRKLEPIVTPTKKLKLDHTSKKIKKEPGTEKSVNKDPKHVPVKVEREVDRKIKIVNRLKFEKGNKVRMYFCNNCNGCCVNDSNRTIHLSKRCKLKRKVRERTICTECGLQFNTKTIVSHRNLHKKRSFTIHDIVFYHIGTLKPIVPSIPTYPQCQNCKITFFSNKMLNNHICGEDYESCKVCAEKFHNSAYNTHIEFHKLIKTVEPRKMEAKMIPELIKKYESFNMWRNIIFSCIKCDIVTDLYDKAIEHSQGHLNQETLSKNIKCYICNLKFDETCWSKHSDLHSRMMISSKDFKILSYNPHELLTEEWFQLFDSVPEEQIRQITDKSLYGYERGVKMKLMKDGRSEFTLYCCSICNVCCPNNEISKHMKIACRNQLNVCKICNIPFNDINALRMHEILHLKGVKTEEFRLVTFMKVKVNDIKLEFKKSTAMFELYKCRNCHTCVRRKYNILKHKCLTENRIRKCDLCNELFNKCFMLRHIEEHKMHPEFNLKNLKIHHFYLNDTSNKYCFDDDDDAFQTVKKRKKTLKSTKSLKATKVVKTRKKSIVDNLKTYNADTSKTAKVFKCGCGLHYTSIKTIEKHIQQCCPDSEISKENCSKCGLLFPTDVLVSHLCKHHSKNMKIVIEPYQRTEEPETSVESTSEKPVQECRRRKTTAKSPTQNCDVKLYKCNECNIYFLVQNTCYKHVYKSHQPIDPKQYIECKLCGLQFTIKSLPMHISRHHQKDFSLDNVLVEEYYPPVGKGPPKIDLYIAAEKVQSLQVTSSIEESRLSNSE